MSKVSEIFGSFKSEKEKEDFMNAQFATITNLTKQVEDLKAKNKHLQELLSKSPLPTIEKTEENSVPEEIRICREQLKLLQNVSQDRELTMEEARKVEIYSKIITQAKDPSKKAKSPLDGLSTEQLLKIANEPDEDKH